MRVVSGLPRRRQEGGVTGGVSAASDVGKHTEVSSRPQVVSSDSPVTRQSRHTNPPEMRVFPAVAETSLEAEM